MHHRSWWLKVKRAQKHMVEVKRCARLYADSHPYEVVPLVRQPKGYSDRWLYTTHITQQPDPMLVVILGDFVHNLRSALDHVVVACAPKKRRTIAGMPIHVKDIWEIGASDEFVLPDNEARSKYLSLTDGLETGAKKIVHRFQPYHMGLDEADRHPFAIISRLENADKHRELISIGSGVENGIFRTFVNGRLIHTDRAGGYGKFIDDGAVQTVIFPGTRPPQSEVQVDCQGTAVITIKITGVRGIEPPADFRLYTTMLGAIDSVRKFLRLMEPFVIR